MATNDPMANIKALIAANQAKQAAAKAAPAPIALPPAAPAPTGADFMKSFIANSPVLQAQKAAADKAAADKAAYDAIPYSQHLKESREAAAAAHAKLDAWKPDPAQTANLPVQLRGASSKTLDALQQLNNPNRQAAQDADAAVNKLIRGHLQDQLLAQSKQYKFDWKAKKNADYHTGTVADMLLGQGLTDLSQLGYSKDGNYLMNKETGQNLKWYKQDKHADNPLKNKGQLGWSAKGEGRTNYMVKPDANGNPVLFPDWKSNAPTGLGGFLVGALPAIVGIATGNPWLAAATSAAEGAIGGQNIGDIVKNAAVSGGSSYLGGLAGGAAKAAGAELGSTGAAALGGAASGATQNAVRGIANGNFDIGDVLTNALAGGVTAGVTSALKPDQLPSNQAGPPAPPTSYTGISAIDKLIPGFGGQVAGSVASGQNVGDAFANAGIGAASNLAGNVVGSAAQGLTGNTYLDNLISGIGQGVVKTGTSSVLNDLINSPSSHSSGSTQVASAPPPPVNTPAPPPPATATPTTPVTNAPPVAPPVAAAPDMSGITALLMGSMLGNQPQQQAAAAQPLFTLGQQFDVNSMFSPVGKRTA